jgi:hypothetical protein
MSQNYKILENRYLAPGIIILAVPERYYSPKLERHYHISGQVRLSTEDFNSYNFWGDKTINLDTAPYGFRRGHIAYKRFKKAFHTLCEKEDININKVELERFDLVKRLFELEKCQGDLIKVTLTKPEKSHYPKISKLFLYHSNEGDIYVEGGLFRVGQIEYNLWQDPFFKQCISNNNQQTFTAEKVGQIDNLHGCSLEPHTVKEGNKIISRGGPWIKPINSLEAEIQKNLRRPLNIIIEEEGNLRLV